MKVSIYLITYNRKYLLERAINSVINQTYKNIELIVVDDFSTDGTKAFLESKFEEYSKLINFHFYINDKNKGACFSRNRAIKKSTGEFITGLDDDDYFLPTRIEKFITAWDKKESKTRFLFSNYRIISNQGVNDTERIKIVKQSDLLLANHVGNQIFVERVFFCERGGFDESLPAWQDLECWYCLLHFGDGECIGDTTYVFDCSHPHERISTSNINNIIQASKLFKIKHKCNDLERSRIDNQLISYRFNISIYFKCLFVYCLNFDWRGIKNLHSRSLRILGLIK